MLSAEQDGLKGIQTHSHSDCPQGNHDWLGVLHSEDFSATAVYMYQVYIYVCIYITPSPPWATHSVHLRMYVALQMYTLAHILMEKLGLWHVLSMASIAGSWSTSEAGLCARTRDGLWDLDVCVSAL